MLFAKEGYKDYKLPLNQYGIDSSVNVGTIQLRTESAFGSISGIVTDSSTGNAIENAEVSFYNGSTLASTYRTTSGGSFYAPLTAGTYTMKVNKEGYGESSTSVTIVAGESKNMNISLTPTAPTVPGDAIHISTPEQFNNIRNDLDAYYILDNDIDLSGYSTWAPIGTTDTPFNGTLDGNGKAITGFRVSSFDMTGESADSSRYYQGVGLFGTVDGGGSIQNLSIENANLNCSWGNGIECYGVLAGKLLEGSISSCSVSGEFSVHSMGNYVGGIVGYGSGRIVDCVNACDIQVSATLNDTNTCYVGGISGYGFDLEHCYNSGNIQTMITASGWTSSSGISQTTGVGGVVGEGLAKDSANVASYLWLSANTYTGPCGRISGVRINGTNTNCVSYVGTAINSGTVTSDDATSIHGKDMNSIQEVENWYNNR